MSEKPLEKEVYRNYIRFYNSIVAEISAFLKNYGLTLTQFDVLESVKNAGRDGLPLLKIGESLVSRQPDVTRIVDRLEAMGVITRIRDTKDRRIVYVKPTKSGLGLFEKLEPLIFEIHRDQFGHLLKTELKTFNKTLFNLSGKADSSSLIRASCS